MSADPAVGIDADINLEVFARGLDGTLLRTVQLPGPGASLLPRMENLGRAQSYRTCVRIT